jgi:hypothetical protein
MNNVIKIFLAWFIQLQYSWHELCHFNIPGMNNVIKIFLAWYMPLKYPWHELWH